MKNKCVILILFLASNVLFSDNAPTSADAMFTVNNTWMLVSTFLVFIMHLGFATLESGLTQAKNTVNILFKNVSIIAIGILTYTLCGFNLMYPGDFNGYLGFSGFCSFLDRIQYRRKLKRVRKNPLSFECEMISK